MRLDFKRIMSSVLAFVMLFSSLVMVNVVSVSAATAATSSYDAVTGKFFLTVDQLADEKNLDSSSNKALSPHDLAGSDKANITTAGNWNYATMKDVNDGGLDYTFTKSIMSGGTGRSIAFTPKNTGKVSVYVYTKGANKKITITSTALPDGSATKLTTTNVMQKVDFTVTPAAEGSPVPSTVTISAESNICICAIEFTPDETSVKSDYTWSFDETTFDALQQKYSNIKKEDIQFTVTGQTSTANGLKYTGNEYIINPDYVYLDATDPKQAAYITKDDEAGTIKVKYKEEMFIPTKGFKPSDIHFDGLEGKLKYVRLDCEVHGDSVHTIYLDEQGDGVGTVTADPVTKHPKQVPASETGGKIWLPEDTYYVTIAGGTVEMTEPTPVGEDKTEIKIDSSTTALKGTFTPDKREDIDDKVIGQKIDLTAGLKVNDDVDEAYISDGAVIANYFEVHGNQGQHGDFALIRSEHMDTDGERSNVAALELKTMVDNSAADSSLRFHVADGASPNLSIRIMCSSSTDSANPSMIGLRTGSSFADHPYEFVTPETIPADKDGSAEGKMYTFEVENLTPGGYYGIYNAGTSETDDDVRIYSIEFYKAAAPATVTPEASKYAFKAQEGTSGRLVTEEKRDPKYTGAYASYDSDDLHVKIADGKATLHDANADSVEMIMPLANTDADGVTSGTVKFSGTLTLLNTDGSKWSLLDFRDSEGKTVAAIRISNGSKGSNPDYNGEASTATGEKYSLAVPYSFKDSSTTVDKYDYHETTVGRGTKDITYDITFDYTNSTITLNVNSAKAEATSVSRMPAIAEIKAMTAGSATDRDYEIGDITIEATSATKYPVKLSGTNNTEGSVELKVMKGTQLIETVTIGSTGAFNEKQLTSNLAAGTYTLAAEGCVVTPSTITVKDSGSADTPQSFTGIKIETSYNVNVKFDFDQTGAAADTNISITKLTADGKADGSAKTIKDKTDSALFEDVTPGTQFKISGTSRNTYQWLSRRNGEVDTDTGNLTFANKDDIKFFNGGKDNRFFIYTVPSNVKELGKGEYGVQFKAEEKIAALDITHKNMKGTPSKETGFGQYGFGEDKKKVCGGKDARENVMEYRFEPAGMDDYISNSYCSNIFNDVLTEFGGQKADIDTCNEFGILNKDGYESATNTFVKFKVADTVVGKDGEKIQAVVDRSGDPIQVFAESSPEQPIETQDIEGSKKGSITKQSFEVKAGETYTIKSSMDKTVIGEGSKQKLTGRTYIKSIRIYNPNNIFDNTSVDAESANTKTDMGAASALQSSNKDLYDKIQAANANPTDHIFRVIGTIHLTDATDQASAESELANIEAVGFDVYTKEKYDSYESKVPEGGNHVNAGSILNDGEVGNKTPDGEIKFEDIVNASVDTDGDGNADITADSQFKQVYVQTFYALSPGEAVVLVPWVQYKSSNSKVYSLIPKTDDANNIVLEAK